MVILGSALKSQLQEFQDQKKALKIEPQLPGLSAGWHQAMSENDQPTLLDQEDCTYRINTTGEETISEIYFQFFPATSGHRKDR